MTDVAKWQPTAGRDPVVDFRLNLDADEAATLLAWGRARGLQTEDFALLVRALIAAAAPEGPRSDITLEQPLGHGFALVAPGKDAYAPDRGGRPGAWGERRAVERPRGDADGSQAFRAAASRILGERAKAPEEWLFLEPPVHLGALEATEPLPPDLVRIGVTSAVRAADDTWTIAAGAPPTSSDPLPALTNRLAPTFWAAAKLVDSTRGGEPVAWRGFLEEILPEAWAIGTGLAVWDEEQRLELRRESGQRRKGLAFQASARWPTLNTSVARQASSVASFVMNSVAVWRPRRQSFTGPLFTLGLAEPVPVALGEWFIRPTPAGIAVSRRLGFAGASCVYPHGEDAWEVIRDCLAWTSTRELERMRWALRALADADSTDAYVEGVSEMIEVMDGEPPRGAQASAQAGAHLARLKECGLANMSKRGVGPGTVTPRGHDLIRFG